MNNQFNNLDPVERDIAEYLFEYCKGLNHAISNEGLAHKFGIDVRTIRSIIANMIVCYELPIGSSSKNLSGVFWIENQNEFEIAHRELISRIKKLSRRARGVRHGWNNCKNEFEVKQLQLI